MQVSLKPEVAELVDALVREGRFASAEEVVEAGVTRVALEPIDTMLSDDDWAAIEESERQIERGEDIPWEEASAMLRRKYLNE